jgi:hypothetical protein
MSDCRYCGHQRSYDLREECPGCGRRKFFIFGEVTPSQRKGLIVSGWILFVGIALITLAALVLWLYFNAQIKGIVTFSQMSHTILISSYIFGA